jgi:rSAM/selenodomain-associated transferase 2
MKISVIIPALNEAQSILSCLDSVKTQQGDFELIVADGGSIDGTAEVVRPHAKVIYCQEGRALQMNSGAHQATGDVLLFLHADSCLPPRAFPLLEQALADSRIVGGTFMLRFDSPRLLLRAISFFTRFEFRYFHYGDQGIFVRRPAFDQLNGFSEIPLMEDIDFLRRLHKIGRVTLLRQPMTTSSRRFLEHGILRQQLLNIVLVALYLLGARPETLKKWYGK